MSRAGAAAAGGIDVAAAINAHVQAGRIEDAARMLVAIGRPTDAAQLLLRSVDRNGPANERQRTFAYEAASLLFGAGDAASAAGVLEALGDHGRAAHVRAVAAADAARRSSLPPAPASSRASAPPPSVSGVAMRSERAGDHAHKLRAAGRLKEAAAAFAQASMLFEAGVCLFDAGEQEQALSHLVAVPVESPTHRSACVYVVSIAMQMKEIPFQADEMLAEFARGDPRTEQELTALFALGTLYETQGFDEEASDAYARVLRVRPNHVEAQLRASRIAQQGRANAAPHVPAKLDDVAKDDVSFWSPQRTLASPRPKSADRAAQSTQPVQAAAPAPTTSPTLPRSGIGPGTLVAGRYRLDKEIGRGGMGTVYRAADEELGETVALKIFSTRLDDPSLVARFKQELTITRQLTHPNVIRLHDMGAHEGMKFITMELLRGVSLRDKVRQISFDDAIRYLMGLTRGLAAVHARGVIHRDVKPANAFVTEEEVVKVMDFGLAKRQDAEEGVTVSGFMAGTPGYMAPEQITSFGSVSAAADVYALGVCIHELVAGVRPFVHKDPSQIIRLQFTTDPLPLRDLAPDAPEPLEQLVAASLSRNPEERPQTAGDVLNALTAIFGER
jgi:serine/threonine-protein kinase